MYSSEWFHTFATTVPASIIESEVAGIAAVLPIDQYPRLLDIGCGIGRIAAPLFLRGYAVTGIDINVEALVAARRLLDGPRYVALDQQYVGDMRWTFDAAVILWNSIGFVGRSVDATTLRGIATSLRPGGRLVLDLYHPDWLSRNEKSGDRDDRGPVVRRWVDGGRCYNGIEYPNGIIDDIQFNLYSPEEITELARDAGLDPIAAMASWTQGLAPDPQLPRYQLVCGRG